jgi:drug/metabolite transporter (DMT)-like permease
VRGRVAGREVALVALAACAFATASPIAKGIAGLSAASIAAGRCVVAGVALVALGPPVWVRAVRALSPRGRLSVALAGVLLAAHFALFLGGLLATSLPAAAALLALEPPAVVIAAWAAFGVRPSARETAGIALATAGAGVVALGAGRGEHTLLGDALVLGAVVIYGAYVAFARGLRDAMPTRAYAASVYLSAAVVLVPLALATEGGRVPSPPASAWLGVAALGLVPTLVGHTLVQRAARFVPPAVVALASPGETVGSIVIGAATGHAPSAIEWAGAGIVVAGAVVTLSGARDPRSA